MSKQTTSWASALILSLIITVLCSQHTLAYDTLIETTTQALPFQTTISFDIQGTINETITITYDNWLSGPGTITFADPLFQLEVIVLIPTGTSPGNYSRTLFLDRNGTIEEKTIAIIIRNTDNDNDGYSPPQDCNDSDPNINPGKNETYYNGKDDDCNPLTEDNFQFSVQISNHEANIGVPIDLSIIAINGSTVRIEICEQGQGFVPCYSPITLPNTIYPTTIRLPYTNSSGAYILTASMTYQGTVKYYETAYVIQNSLSATIEGDLQKDTNEMFTIRITPGGGITPYTYLWKIPEKPDYAGSELNVSYATSGERVLNITITDKAGNQLNTTMTLTVKKTYPVIITVTDNNTGSRVPDATITVKDKEVKTDTNGQARLTISQGTHTFSVLKEGYDLENVRYTIDRETNFTISLAKKDTIPPGITLITPANNSITNDGTFTYAVTDESLTSCEIFVGLANESLLALKNKTANLPAGTYAATVSLHDGMYKWRVHCEDNKQNKAKSSLSFFEMKTGALPEPAAVIEQQADKGQINLIDELYNALDRMKTFSFQEQEAAELLDYEQKINDALKLIERANRDINDLKYRVDLSDREKEEKSKDIAQKIEDIYSNTPINLKVNKDKVFLKYPSEDEMVSFMDTYYKTYSKAFRSLIIDYQKKASAQTRAMQITLEFIDGSTKEITLIAKELTIANQSREDILIEIIPTGIANPQEITFSQNTVRTQEGIYQVEEPDQQLIYQIEKIIPLEKTENLITIIINKKFVPDMTIPTGYATISLGETLTLRNLLVILALILCLAFILHQTDGAAGLKAAISRGNKQLNYARVIITDARDQADAGNLHDARQLFSDLKNIYAELREKEQYNLSAEINNLASFLDKQELLSRIRRCRDCLESKETGLAISEYQNMQALFNILPEEDRESVYPEVISLHNTLQQCLNNEQTA
ncbi:MAG: MopE-related protein [Nanoarchaeota archaeon]